MSTISEWALWIGVALAAIGVAFALAAIAAVERRKRRRALHETLQHALVESVFTEAEVPASLRRQLSDRSQLLAWLQVHERLAGEMATECRSVAIRMGLDRTVASFLRSSSRRGRVLGAIAAGRLRLVAEIDMLRALSERGDALEAFAAIDALVHIEGSDTLGTHLLRLLGDTRRPLAEVRDVALLHDDAQLQHALREIARTQVGTLSRQVQERLSHLEAVSSARAAEAADQLTTV